MTSAEGANSISSMDQPSILVRILHAIPHVNYTFRRVNDTFNPDSDIYFESLGILASIPAALLILSLFGLLLYLLTRCCDRKPRKPSAQRCQNCTLVIITLMCCAAIGLGLYGNDDFHNGLLQAFSSGKQVEGLVGNLKKQTESIKINLETKVQGYNLEEQIDKSQYNQTAVTILLETCRLVRDNTSRAVTSLDNMVLYFMKTKGTENDTSLKGVLHLGEFYESIRWPATLGFLTLLLLLCTILVIGVARRSRCALIFFSVSGLLCIIICWLLSGIYLATSVAAGDFCMRPHEFMCRQVGMRSPYVYFLNCGTLRNRFILRLNESRDLVERARESVFLVSRMSQDVYPRIDIRQTLERMDNDLEETKRNLSVLSATLDRRSIDKHYADALRGLCGGGLLGLSLMMIAGLLTSFLLTILVYADSHAWIYLTKRPPVEADKSETTPLFPMSSTPNATVSPTAPAGTGTINRTLLHHQQAHSSTLGVGGIGSGGTGGHHHRNGTAGLRSGLAYTTTSSNTGGGGSDGNSSPPPGYDVVVHGTRSGHHTLGRLPSQQSAYLAGPNNGSSSSMKNIFASATLPRSSASSIKSTTSTAHTMCKTSDGLGGSIDKLGEIGEIKDPRDVTNNSFNRFDPKYISIGPKAVRGNNNLNIVAAATANKCATLRHVGRYGGSLKSGTSPSPNLRSAKTPSIATVSKDYCNQPDCIPPYKKTPTTNTFTDIPGTTGVGSSIAAAAAKKENDRQQQLQQYHQQQQQQQQQPQSLPSVYSIETVPYRPPPPTQPSQTVAPAIQQQQQQAHQSHKPHLQQNQQHQQPQQPQSQSRQQMKQLSSIVNQPLPEIPQHQQQQHSTKISQQPLCAANLNSYRSLQRPTSQKLQISSARSSDLLNNSQSYSTQSQQQQSQQIMQSNKIIPPSLPPKNRHKEDPSGGGRLAPRHSAVNMQTLPPKSSSLRQQQQQQQQQHQSTHSTFGYDRGGQNIPQQAERPRRSETLDNGSKSSTGMSYMEQYKSSTRHQQQEQHYPPYHQQQSSSSSHRQPSNVVSTASSHHGNINSSSTGYHSSSSKNHYDPQQQQQQQQNAYYRSLKRGGSHANNDLYSVTEL